MTAALKEFDNLALLVGVETAAHLIAESSVGIKFNLKPALLIAAYNKRNSA